MRDSGVWDGSLEGTREPRTTVIDGKVVVKDGQIVTMDMGRVIETHNRCARDLANGD